MHHHVQHPRPSIFSVPFLLYARSPGSIITGLKFQYQSKIWLLADFLRHGCHPNSTTLREQRKKIKPIVWILVVAAIPNNNCHRYMIMTAEGLICSSTGQAIINN